MTKTILTIMFLFSIKTLIGQNNFYENFNLPKLIPFQKNNKFGFCNSKKKIVIKCKFDFVLPFNEDCDIMNSENEKERSYGTKNFATVLFNNKKFRIDTLGKIVFTFPKEFNNCELAVYLKNFQVYKEGDKFGIKIGDSIIIKAKYQNIFPITNLKQSPPFIAKLDNKFGLVDSKNKLVNFVYDNIKYPFEYSELSCPLIIVEKNKFKYYVDFKGIEYFTK